MDDAATDLLASFRSGLRARAVRTGADLGLLEQRLASSRRTVIVCGAGIAGLAAASTFARGSVDEVVLVVGQPPVRKRLVDGCTVRRSTVSAIARAMGTSPEEVFERLGGKRAAFDAGVILRGHKRTPAWRIDPSAVARFGEPLGLSSRHGEILRVVRELVPDSPRLHLVAGSVQPSGDADGGVAIALSGGTHTLTLPKDRALVLNAAGKVDLFTSSKPSLPRRWAAAVQAPMRFRGSGPRWGATTAIAFMLDAPPLQHLALLTPFADPDTPEARWYAINTTVIRDAELQSLGRERVLAEVRAVMHGMADELNLEPVDLDDTVGQAMFPADRTPHPGFGFGVPVVHASLAFSPGVAAINADGMLAGAVGALSFAEQFSRSVVDVEPRVAADRALAASSAALAGIRRRNELSEWTYFHAPAWVRIGASRCLAEPVMRAYLDDFSNVGSAAPS